NTSAFSASETKTEPTWRKALRAFCRLSAHRTRILTLGSNQLAPRLHPYSRKLHEANAIRSAGFGQNARATPDRGRRPCPHDSARAPLRDANYPDGRANRFA